MGLFRRSASTNSTQTSSKPHATTEQLQEIGRLVNEGKVRKATRITRSTADPRGAAFAAFRYIDVEPPQ